MGFFDFFSKKNTPPVSVAPVSPLMEMVEVKPGIKIARAFANDWSALEASRLYFVSIEAVPVERMKLEHSKFGHYPKIPAGFAYPTGSSGDYLYPLAQLNFKEIQPLPGYPNEGFLQIYISVAEDAYGMDFDDGQSQKDFRVLYFEEHAVEDHETDFSFLQDIMSTNNSPVYKPHALSFALKGEYIGLSDVRYDDNAGRIVAQVLEKYPDIADDLEESLYDNFESSGHKIGGYAYFTQSDPRAYNESFKDYIVLLQIDTDNDIMWGDSGVANFFIHPDDLAKKDFSKVLYNWDCC